MIATTDASGTATPYAYSVTGEPKGGWSSSAPAFRYTGQVAIPSAQIYYYKARMYDPALGRFLQTDPVGYQAGMNLYAYVMNDYASSTDSSGLLCDEADQSGCAGNPYGLAGGESGGGLRFDSSNPENVLNDPNGNAGGSRCPAGVECVVVSWNPGYAQWTGLPVSSAGELIQVAAETRTPGGAGISPKIARQMLKRGWTPREIDQAMKHGRRIGARNMRTGGPATRYVNPSNGQSVVIDDTTGDIIQVGGPGFKFGEYDNPGETLRPPPPIEEIPPIDEFPIIEIP